MALPTDNDNGLTAAAAVVHNNSTCEEDVDIDAFFLPGGILDPDAGTTTATTTTEGSSSVGVLTTKEDPLSATVVAAEHRQLTTAHSDDGLSCLLPPRSPSQHHHHHHHHSSPLPMNPWEAVTTTPSSPPSVTTIASRPALGGLVVLPDNHSINNVATPSDSGSVEVDNHHMLLLASSNHSYDSASLATMLPDPTAQDTDLVATTEDLSSWLLLSQELPATTQQTASASVGLISPTRSGHHPNIPNNTPSSSTPSPLSDVAARTRLEPLLAVNFLPMAPDSTKPTEDPQADSLWWSSGVVPDLPLASPLEHSPPPPPPHTPLSLRPFPPPPGFELDSTLEPVVVTTAPRTTPTEESTDAVVVVSIGEPPHDVRVQAPAASAGNKARPPVTIPEQQQHVTSPSSVERAAAAVPRLDRVSPAPPDSVPLQDAASSLLLSTTMTSPSSSSKGNKRKKKHRSSHGKSPEGRVPAAAGETVTIGTGDSTTTTTIHENGHTAPILHGNGHAAEPIAIPEEEESLGQSMVRIWTSIRSFLEPWTRWTARAAMLVVKYILIFFIALGTMGDYALEEGALGLTRLWHEILSTLRIHPHHHYYYEPRQTSEYVLCTMVLYLFPFFCDVLMNYTDCPHYTPHILSNAALYALSLRLSRLSWTDYTNTVPAKRGKPSSSTNNSNTSGSSSARSSFTTNYLSEADRRQLEYQLGHRILRSLRYAIPCNFVLEGFSAANASFALADPSMRLVLAYSMSLVRHGLLLSPVAWMGWSTQILLAAHLPARGLQLDFILILVGLAFLRLVGTLNYEQRARIL